MKYTVSIDVPNIDDRIRSYGRVFGLAESARPVEGCAVLRLGEVTLGILEKAQGTKPAPDSNDIRRYERHWTPVHVDFRVDDLETVLDGILSAGGKCEQKFDGGKYSPIAFCSDPFGNGFCVLGKSNSE